MRALEFQCPLKFRCQTRDIIHKGLLDIKDIETRGLNIHKKGCCTACLMGKRKAPHYIVCDFSSGYAYNTSVFQFYRNERLDALDCCNV